MPSINNPISDLLMNGESHFLHSVSVDCVILGFHESQLKVLLIKHRHRDMWALPGGFIYKHEPTEAAAYRVLKERTGLDDVFLQEFQVFGHPNRSPKEFHLEDFLNDGISIDPNHWILQRYVTIGYYALVEFAQIQQTGNRVFENSQWWDIHELPQLILDHEKIVQRAISTLRLQLDHQPIGYNLLPEKFTMPELQKLYETLLDKKLDRRNFQRKILSFNILQRLEETKKGVAHKAPYYYKFDLDKYNEALREGFNSGW